MKKWQLMVSVMVALVAVLSLSVAAFAQGPQPGAGAPQGAGIGRGPVAGAGYGFRFGPNGGSLVDVTADVAGIGVQDVVAELRAGKTFAQVAAAHGKTAGDLVNAFLAERQDALKQAVDDGRLTQAAADTMLATMKANVEQHVDSTWQPRGMGYRFNVQ
jgi:hypothetical protein